MKSFTKVRKWATEVGAKVEESNYFDKIYVILPNNKKFELENNESTVRRVINRGRGTKSVGNPKGMYFTDVPEKGYGGYKYQTTQAKAISEMSKYL